MRYPLKSLFNTALLALLLPLLALSGCHTVPESGRQAFVLMDLQTEFSMGLQAYSQMRNELPVSSDVEYNRRVQSVGHDIARVANQPEFEWEFTVFDQPDTINAWCLPGGKIGVYTGLFQLVKNKNQLAFVMAHEVGHAVARHGAERMSYQLVLAAGAEVVAAAMGQNDGADDVAIERMKTVYGIGSSLFILLPFSRRDEYEADRIGIMYMADAGYDPRAAIELQEKFVAYHDEQGGGMPEYLSTHPSDNKRLAELNKLLPEAMRRYNRATGRAVEEDTPDDDMENLPKVKLRTGGTEQKGRHSFTGVKIGE